MSVTVHMFEGRRLHTVDFGGHPAWVAREIGAIAGYAARGQRLVKKILGPWRDELVEGVDYLFMAGKPDGMESHLDVGAAPLVLFRSGVDVVLGKTCKPIGKRLRKFIVTEVVPAWEPAPAAASPTPLRPGESTDPSVLRETRLRDKLDYLDRRFRSAALSRANRILRDLGRIDDETFAFTELMATQIALGVDLPEGLDLGSAS
ncbi:MAG: hypothetical protein KC656_28785 [Myxococcales bacterium]|nr:hypothetical protein [Myxococcales bacterium]